MDAVIENFNDLLYFSPSARNLFLKRAHEEYKKGNYLASVLYQIKVVNGGYAAKFDSRYFEKRNLQQNSNKTVKRNPNVQEFLDWVRNETKNLEQNNIENGINEDKLNCNNVNSNNRRSFSNDLKNFENVCKKMPKEWTVVQICRDYDPNRTVFNIEENLSSNTPLYLSVLHHPRSDKYGVFSIKIDLSENEDFIKEFAALSNEYKTKVSFKEAKNLEGRKKYWAALDEFEKKTEDIIEKFQELFRPWSFLLAGNAHPKDNEFQIGLFKKIDSFASANRLSGYSIAILSMISRQLPLMSTEMITPLVDYILKVEKNVCRETLTEFVEKLKRSFGLRKLVFRPCILIVEESLDHFCWEMLNTCQEICRVSSWYLLESLLNKYQGKIRDGYLQVSAKNITCLINAERDIPEKNLRRMENRMKNFLNFFLPNCKLIAGRIPELSEMEEWLKTSDVYLYAGHGSGLHLINRMMLKDCDNNAIIFLFGCESTKLKSYTAFGEMTGSHIFFHASGSPAVIGTLEIVLDFHMDNITAFIVSSWIPSDKEVAWKDINLSMWRKEGEIEIANNNNVVVHDPRLSYILSKLRDGKEQNFLKSILVYRGLPVWNECANKNRNKSN